MPVSSPPIPPSLAAALQDAPSLAVLRARMIHADPHPRCEERVTLGSLVVKEGKLANGAMLTAQALVQLCAFLHVPPFYFQDLYGLSPKLKKGEKHFSAAHMTLADINLNTLLALLPPAEAARTIRLRLRYDAKRGLLCRAIVTERYQAHDHAEVLTLLEKVLPCGAGAPGVLSCGEDGEVLTLSAVFPSPRLKATDSEYGVGFMLLNSEDGSLRLEIVPLLYRVAEELEFTWGLGRHLATGKGAYARKHLGERTREQQEEEITAAVHDATRGGERLFHALEASRQFPLYDPEALLVLLCRQHKLTINQGKALLAAYEKSEDATGFGVACAFSRAAGGARGEQSLMLTVLAGELVAPDLQATWERLGKHWHFLDQASRRFRDEQTGLIEKYQ